jgi:hypothetical protein
MHSKLACPAWSGAAQRAFGALRWYSPRLDGPGREGVRTWAMKRRSRLCAHVAILKRSRYDERCLCSRRARREACARATEAGYSTS